MPSVVYKDGETIDQLIKRFQKISVTKRREFKKREFFLTVNEKNKLKQEFKLKKKRIKS